MITKPNPTKLTKVNKGFGWCTCGVVGGTVAGAGSGSGTIELDVSTGCNRRAIVGIASNCCKTALLIKRGGGSRTCLSNSSTYAGPITVRSIVSPIFRKVLCT